MIVDVELLKPEWNDVIVVTIDYHNLPPHLRHQLNEDSVNHLKSIFPNNKIIIKGISTNIKLEQEDEPLLVGSGGGKSG